MEVLLIEMGKIGINRFGKEIIYYVGYSVFELFFDI